VRYLPEVRTVALLVCAGCWTSATALPKPGAGWQSFRTSANPIPNGRHGQIVVRGDDIWVDADPYGANTTAWALDTRRLTWRKHTSAKFTVTWRPSINIGHPLTVSKLPPPAGQGFNIHLNQTSNGTSWAYSLVAHDWKRDRWIELTHHLAPNASGDGTVFHHEIGDRFVQLTGTTHDARNYVRARVVEVASGTAAPLFAAPIPEVERQRYYYGVAIDGDRLAVFGGTSVELNMYDQQRDDKARASAIITGWLHDLRTRATRELPPISIDGAELAGPSLCFAGNHLILQTGAARGKVAYHVLDLAAPAGGWKRTSWLGLSCDKGSANLLTVSHSDRGEPAISDHDPVTGNVTHHPLPKAAGNARGMPTPDGDKLVFAPTVAWRGGYYSRTQRRWTDFPPIDARHDFTVVAVTDRALVLWGRTNVVRTIKGGGCDGPRDPRQGCDPVADEVIKRADPTGYAISF
jgi:hypothetical protein